MSAKILNQTKDYQPVTIELTFDTLEQLKCFYKLYRNPYDTADALLDGSQEVTDAIDATIDFESLSKLSNIIDQYKQA